MSNPITKPAFPPPIEPTGDPDEYYKYLASVGLSISDLAETCVKEVEITGISDTGFKHVNVFYNGSDYSSVPVWINTDIGARKSFLNDDDLPVAADYFKDAALIWPLGQSNLFYYKTNGGSFKPIVPLGIALIGNDGVPLAVIGAVSSVDKQREVNGDYFSCFPTWRPYAIVLLRTQRYEVPAGHTIGYDPPDDDPVNSPIIERRMVLLDLLSGEVANIPNEDKTALVAADFTSPGDEPWDWKSLLPEGGFSIMGGVETSTVAWKPEVPLNTSGYQSSLDGYAYPDVWVSSGEYTHSLNWTTDTTSILDTSTGSAMYREEEISQYAHSSEYSRSISKWSELLRHVITVYRVRYNDDSVYLGSGENFNRYLQFGYRGKNFSLSVSIDSMSYGGEWTYVPDFGGGLAGFYNAQYSINARLVNEDIGSILSLHTFSRSEAGEFSAGNGKHVEGLSIVSDESPRVVGLKDNFLSHGFVYSYQMATAECSTTTSEGSISGGVGSIGHNFVSHAVDDNGIIDVVSHLKSFLDTEFSLASSGLELSNNSFLMPSNDYGVSLSFGSIHQYLVGAMSIESLNIVLIPYDVTVSHLE